MDQRICIKFWVKNEIKCRKVCEMLTKAYGKSAMSKTRVYEWYKNFQDSREVVENNERSGRPRTHGENFMAIFTTRSVVIWFSTGTLGIFATLVYIFTMRVVIYDILSTARIPTLSTSILFCYLCYIPLWISPRSVVKIAIRIQKTLQH